MNQQVIKLLIAIATAGFLPLSSAIAAVTGECADCHVMHATQDSAPTYTAYTPEGYLLNKTCLGCHTGTNDGANTTPYVYKATDPTVNATLAGGSFYYSELVDDRKGHNPFVTGVLAADVALTAPPGWKTGFTDSGNGQVGTIDATHPLTCAGVYGCHGRHDGVAEGMHHADVTGEMGTVDGTTLGKSYRFLKGIAGGEVSHYEYPASLSTTSHNVYKGHNRAVAAADTATDKSTISYFCAECHGIFHSGAGTEGIASDTLGSPWIRHPVDFTMSTTGEYGLYASYNPAVPVASTGGGTLATTTSGLNAATDRVVMCLSCHRGHASPYDAALRWDPADVSAGGAESSVGCFACHNYKDDGD